jgi:hypothetical protein
MQKKLWYLFLSTLLGLALALACQPSSSDDDDDDSAPLECSDYDNQDDCESDEICVWAFTEESTDTTERFSLYASAATTYPDASTGEFDRPPEEDIKDDEPTGYCAEAEELDCIDEDGDGYGEGEDCLGADCDDSDAEAWEGAKSCPALTGDATLTFSLHKDAYQPAVGLSVSGCVAGTAENSIGCDGKAETLVLMLCSLDDPTCNNPAVIRAITAAEIHPDAELIQDYWGGEDFTITDLPAGEWGLMLMIDGYQSIDEGMAWDDDFDSTEIAWGGIASDGDLLLGAAYDEPRNDYNPPATPWEITLTDGGTTDIGEDPDRGQMYDGFGSVWLSHYHLQPTE